MLISFLKQQRQLSHKQVGEQTFSDDLSVQVSNLLLCHPQRISMQADCLKVAVLLLGNHKVDRSELMTFIYLSFFFKERLCFGRFFTSSLQPREFSYIFFQSYSYACLKGYQKNAYIDF